MFLIPTPQIRYIYIHIYIIWFNPPYLLRRYAKYIYICYIYIYIIWFDPPYNERVSNNIAKNFLKLIDTHFGKNIPLHKYFHKNNIKVSYRL